MIKKLLSVIHHRQITEIAMNLLVQGRRHLLVSDIPSAIAALAESSQLLVEQYGEFADECAESYYYYGMALLEMARTNSDVLGDAVEGGDISTYFIWFVVHGLPL